MAKDTGHYTALDHIIKFIKNDQASPLLPVAGLGAGALTGLLTRKQLPQEEVGKYLLRCTLMGGLTGTGAELARVGSAKGWKHLTQAKNIPGGVGGVIVGKPLEND